MGEETFTPAAGWLSLNAARRSPLLKVDGNEMDLSTMYRLARRGSRGRVLRTTFVGGRMVTCREWIAAYVEAPADREPPAAETRAPSRRLRAVRRAEAELSAAGV